MIQMRSFLMPHLVPWKSLFNLHLELKVLNKKSFKSQIVQKI
eukprot:bmy_10913T0